MRRKASLSLEEERAETVAKDLQAARQAGSSRRDQTLEMLKIIVKVLRNAAVAGLLTRWAESSTLPRELHDIDTSRHPSSRYEDTLPRAYDVDMEYSTASSRPMLSFDDDSAEVMCSTLMSVLTLWAVPGSENAVQHLSTRGARDPASSQASYANKK